MMKTSCKFTNQQLIGLLLIIMVDLATALLPFLINTLLFISLTPINKCAIVNKYVDIYLFDNYIDIIKLLSLCCYYKRSPTHLRK